MSRPKNLYDLQQVDSQIDAARARQKEIRTILANDQNLRKAKVLAARAKKNLETAQKEQRSAETKVKDQRLKIEQTEATLYGGRVQNPKELQDLQNEVGALKRFLAVLEDRQLETMLAVDEATGKHQDAQKILRKYLKQAEQQNADLTAESQQLETQVAGWEAQRETMAAQIDAGDLTTYENLRKRKAGVATAKVHERACSACGSTLTAALHQAARSPSQIVFCGACGRILYGE